MSFYRDYHEKRLILAKESGVGVVVNSGAPEIAQRSTSMSTNRILRKKEVLHLTGISAATMYRLISKGEFPVSKKLTGNGGRAVGWGLHEIESWIESRGINSSLHM